VKQKRCDCCLLLTDFDISGVNDTQIEGAFLSAGVKGFRCFGSNWINQQIRDKKRLRMLVPRVYGLGDLSEILDERAYTQALALLNSMREDLSKGGCPTLRGFRRLGFRQLTLSWSVCEKPLCLQLWSHPSQNREEWAAREFRAGPFSDDAIKRVDRSQMSATTLTPIAGYADLIPHFCRISVIGHHLVNAD